jgi:CRISPR-associated protein Cas1
LAGICLPDETLALRRAQQMAAGGAAPPTKPRSGEGDEDPTMIRRLYPPRPDGTPLYVQHQGGFVGKKGDCLIVRVEGEEVTRVGLKDVSQLVLCGNVQVSTQTLHLLCDADIPVVLLSSGMWFHGIVHGQSLRNAYDRAAQFHTAADPARSLAFARALVRDKALNQRTQLRRNSPPSIELDRTLEEMDDMIARVASAAQVDMLLGMEGNVARCYFSRFGTMIKPRDFDSDWDFNARNRRPPKDPVNAMLSFAYALVVKECTVALLAEGLDPYWGLYHRPRHGRPAMALDLMEPFRPVIADSAVITAINTGMVQGKDFARAASGCAMNDAGRKGLLRAYEARLDQLVTHPLFDYRCSWRSVIRLQARLLSRWLRGDIPEYTNLVTR